MTFSLILFFLRLFYLIITLFYNLDIVSTETFRACHLSHNDSERYCIIQRQIFLYLEVVLNIAQQILLKKMITYCTLQDDQISLTKQLIRTLINVNYRRYLIDSCLHYLRPLFTIVYYKITCTDCMALTYSLNKTDENKIIIKHIKSNYYFLKATWTSA